MNSYEKTRLDYDDIDDDLDDCFDEDRDDEEYFEGYQQGIKDSQRNSLVKKEKEENENFWKPIPDYLDEYDYYCLDCERDLREDDCE